MRSSRSEINIIIACACANDYLKVLGSGINQAYRTGRGKIKVRAVSEIEPLGANRQKIVVTELPYLVNKARLIEKIAELVRDKRIDGISDLRDESDREGMRVVIELKKDANYIQRNCKNPEKRWMVSSWTERITCSI